jgi:hypothetical protein
MKKYLFVFTFFVLIGSTSLFAQTFDLGSGLVLTKYSNGSYSLDDNIRGICYDISIQRDSSNSFSVRVGRWVRDKITEYGIETAISWCLERAGMASYGAGIAAGAIVGIFSPSPAH